MDFTTRKNKLDFTVDGEQFHTKSAIASGIIFRLQGTFAKLGDKDAVAERDAAFDALKGVYEKILMSESWSRFEPLIEGDCEDMRTPIDPLTLVDITQWLIGEGLGKDPTPEQAS